MTHLPLWLECAMGKAFHALLPKLLFLWFIKIQHIWDVNSNIFQLIEGWTKWPTFCRRHFEIDFREQNCLNFDLNFTKFCFQWFNCQYVNIGTGNGLAPNRQQSITRTNVDQDLSHYLTSLGHNALNGMSNTFLYFEIYCLHYDDVIKGVVASQITSLTTEPFIQTHINDNIKAPRQWPLCGEFTGDRWIPRTNGQWRGKCFHWMTSSWFICIDLDHVLMANLGWVSSDKS